MPVSDLFRACPALETVLRQQPALIHLVEHLLEHGHQGVIIRYLANAPIETVQGALQDLARVDLERVERHRVLQRQGEQKPLELSDLEPIALTTLEEQRPRRPEDVAAGFSALANGWWASVAFAGGAGTRFFSSLGELAGALDTPNEVLRRQHFEPGDPKGVFPISPVGGLSFLELIFADALHAGIRCGRLPLVLILTSSVTHLRTLKYLGSRDLWGFPAGGFVAFEQASEPRLDERGDLVVADESGRLAWTGDGHGGVYRALATARDEQPPILERLRRDGVRHLVLHNVDNAAAHPFEPGRLGFHQREEALFTVSAVRKVDPAEKVGLLMRRRDTGKLEVVEYNVLDPRVARERDADTGRLRFEAANINTSLVSLEAVRPDIEQTLYAGKTISSRIGEVKSSSVEMLSQHLTRLLDPSRVRAYEVARDRYFMPTKNVTGPDSVATTVTMLSNESVRILRGAGATVDNSAWCDLHPACGFGADTLALRGFGPGWTIGPKARLYLCARLGPEPDMPVGRGSLTLEPGSTLILDGARPYGDLTLERSRQLRSDRRGASRMVIGRNVVVGAGVRVVLRAAAGGCLKIKDGKEFKENLEVSIPRGETLEI